jgi:hypothetical protein
MRTTESSTLVDALTSSSFEIINPCDELSNYYKVSKFMNIKEGILELSPTINFITNI